MGWHRVGHDWSDLAAAAAAKNKKLKKKKKEERMRKTKPRKTRPFKNEITQSFFKTRHQWERDIVII